MKDSESLIEKLARRREEGERGHLVVVRQEAKRMATVGVADHVQRQVGHAHGVDCGGQVLPAPVQIVHAETFQRGRTRAADAPVVQCHDLVTLAVGKFGKAAVKALRHAGGAGHHQVGARRALGPIADGPYCLNFCRRPRSH